MRDRRPTRHALSGVSIALAAALGVVSGVATDTVAWLGGWSWAVVGALVAAGVVVEAWRGGGEGAAGSGGPDHLPRDVGDFTGREAEMLELRNLVKDGSRTLLISAIDGTAGVGKSTLQIHLAHSVAKRFPDARLYANLRGGEDAPEPVDPLVVLEQFLRGLGERRVPQRLDEAAAVYRARLAGKRALVLLDNASTAEQVRPLLPGSATCTVVITSRARLAGLEGVHRLTLRVFSDEEAVELLTRIVGSERVSASPDTAARVVAYCGRLPLALRIAGSRLAHRPEWTMETLAERLADERERLAALTAGDLDVRACFMISYRELDATEKRAFRLASAARTADLPSGAAAAALGVSAQDAKALLDRLVELHLLEPAAPDGLQYHDLLRLFARERSEGEDTEAERNAALGRVMAWYLARTAEEAAAASASVWLEREQENVMALIEQAAALDGEARAYCWRLAFALAPYLEARGELTSWQDTARTAADAAAGAGDPVAHALGLANLGRLREARGDLPGAEELLADAVRRLRTGDEPRSLAQGLQGLARVRRERGALDGAREAAEEALTLHRRTAPAPESAGPDLLDCLVESGDIASARGGPARAVEHFEEALREAGDPPPHGFDPASVLARLGDALREVGRHDDARAAFDTAASRYEERGDRAAYATMLEQAGLTHDMAGRPREAVAAYDRSERVYRSLGMPADEYRLGCNRAVSLWRAGRPDQAAALLQDVLERAGGAGGAGGNGGAGGAGGNGAAPDVVAGARINLGELLLADGDTERAQRLFDQARAACRDRGDLAGEARALVSLARARTRAGDGHGAVAALRTARERARAGHDAVLTVGVLVDLGLAHRDRGERHRAGELLAEAVRTARDLPVPDPALTARALTHLAGLEASEADIPDAVRHFEEARRLFRACGDTAKEAGALMYLGQVHREGPGLPRHHESARAYDEAALLWRELGDGEGEGRARAAAAVARAHLGDARAAEQALAGAGTLLSGGDAALVARWRALARDRATLPRQLPW